jgi:hypothetical protein
MLKYHERHHAKLGKGIENIIDEKTDALSSQLSNTIATGFEEFNIRFDDTASNSGVSQTSYAPSIWEGSDKLTVPPPPRESADEEPFECPYCFYIITIKNKNSWAHHVFRDLMPYTCVFPECPSPNQLYGSRREWFSHLSSAHMSKVMGNECPFQCGATSLSASTLEKHVGRHLEELALFAIPRPSLDNEDEDYMNLPVWDSYDSDDAEADLSFLRKAPSETGSALGQDADRGQDMDGDQQSDENEEISYMAAQKEMFAAEERAQMNMGRTEEEFAERMNEAAWRTTNSAATDKIQ